MVSMARLSTRSDPSGLAVVDQEGHSKGPPMTFRDLHYRESPFVLPNAWDVPSVLAHITDGRSWERQTGV